MNAVIANSLEGFLEGSVPCSSQVLDQNQTQVNPEYPVWQRYNCNLMCWIYSSLSEEKMGEIVNLDSAPAIWHLLKKAYDCNTTARIMTLEA